MKNKLNNDLLFAYDINQDIRLSLTNSLSWESKLAIRGLWTPVL